MMPWQQAAAQEAQLVTEQKLSSGFVILTAYREFKEGVDVMKALEKKPLNGAMAWVGKPSALLAISNAVMRDPRVFHFDCPDWIEKYNQQVMFEAEFHKAWKDGGANVVMERAPARLAIEGWDAVRPALSTTIRAWIMCGFMAKSTGRHLVAMEFYSRVVNILDWGRRVWQNVSKDDRGVIFEKTFVRGVKRLRLAALHECLAAKENGCQYNRNDMAEWSRDLISETEANPPSPNDQLDPGFFASFWLYPKAEAFSMMPTWNSSNLPSTIFSQLKAILTMRNASRHS
ncbi:hypothetical protein GALMADRAFT_368117 [Galerina marginata CBS 339.88]|uniref:Uncharacterized protein n=1 Tax=Galerina marginata (strain CBS 339.88) TaxID=685588 RepID=A0A067TQR3_GALM3|nr:hypothetical protein GALMADRAFT_368117 [Galerina marginata CBS 339.88]